MAVLCAALAASGIVGTASGAASDQAVPSAPAGDATCPSFQGLVNAAPSGGTITVPPCTYHEAVSIGKPLTVNAAGAIIDGDDTRGVGIAVTANDVTIDGLTVTRVRATDSHKGAVWTTGISRFTFRNGVARDSAAVCISINGGTGHRVLDSELTGCTKEGYFLNGVSDTVFARNNIHHNNPNLAYDMFQEAGGGKTMASTRVTFDANEVAYNRGPGIWFDNGVTSATVSNNRVHHNDREGIFFEISSGASITGNAVWSNGWAFVAWGYGAGITISSSDNAKVSNNTIAWNGRGVSVISQDRQLSPHTGNEIHDNAIMSTSGSFVTGFYDDHGGSLFLSGSGNRGYANRYWVGTAEPSSGRFQWAGERDTLAAYNATQGEDGATYLSTTERDAILGSANMPNQDGYRPPLPEPSPNDPRLSVRTGQMGASSVPGRLSWSAVSGAVAYQVQIQRDGGSFSTLQLASALSRSVSTTFAVGHAYRGRMRVKNRGGTWSGWSYSPTSRVLRFQESSASITYSGRWRRAASTGASGGYVRYATAAGATARLSFYGRAVAWIAPKGSTRGSARVYVDGSYAGTVSLYRTSFLPRMVVFTGAWPTSANHTLEIRVIGTSGRPRIDLDAFVVLR